MSSTGRPRSRVHQRQRLCSHLRDGGLYRSHKVGEERLQVGVARVEGQPANPQGLPCLDLGSILGLARRQPLGEQGRLSEPGRGRNKHQPRHRRRVCLEFVISRSRGTSRRRGAGRAQLGRQDWHLASVGGALRKAAA